MVILIEMNCIEGRIWELIKWSFKGKCSDLLITLSQIILQGNTRDQAGEFVCGYWSLKG